MIERFRYGHASHRDWRMAVEMALSYLEAQRTDPAYARAGALGLIYMTPELAAHAEPALNLLRQRTQIHHWVGAVGASVLSQQTVLQGAPALSLMVLDVTPNDFHLFSGRDRARLHTIQRSDGLPFVGSALVHGDNNSVDLGGLIDDMVAKTGNSQIFGAISSPEPHGMHIADQFFSGGLSGVQFSPRVPVLSRSSQACVALGPVHTVTAAEGSFVHQLDGQLALDVLLDDLGVPASYHDVSDAAQLVAALPMAKVSKGIYLAAVRGRRFDPKTVEIHDLAGVDPKRRMVATRFPAFEPQQALAFCTRSLPRVAQQELRRMLTGLRDELEQNLHLPMAHRSLGHPIRGAVYYTSYNKDAFGIRMAGRELAMIQEILGPIPVIGFMSNGEITNGRSHQHSKSLTLWLAGGSMPPTA